MAGTVSGVDPEANTRRIAAGAGDGDPTGWFERLYRAADAGEALVPWDRRAPHRLLLGWPGGGEAGADRSAVVVGAGLGDDAEYVAGLGYATTAFDVAPTAVEAARRRFPGSDVDYVVADLLEPPPEWRHAFDLVVESLTVQSLPPTVRERAIGGVRGLLAPGGTLLVISTARGEPTPLADGPPWPLTREEIESFGSGPLRAVQIEEIADEAQPSIRRWRAEFRRDGAP
jgi:SAM-dependent methyltransferase